MFYMKESALTYAMWKSLFFFFYIKKSFPRPEFFIFVFVLHTCADDEHDDFVTQII